MAVRVVDSLEEAVAHIAAYGTGHSECIVTDSYAAAEQFTAQVDAAWARKSVFPPRSFMHGDRWVCGS